MKLRHVRIENFKGLKHLDLPLVTEQGGDPRRLTCLLGDNGSGKTTALQAIALTLSLATRRTRYPTEFRWHGFLPERVGSQGPTFVELTVDLDQEEVDLTSALFQDWYDAQSSDWKQTHRVVEPSKLRQVRLVYENGRVSSPQGLAAVNQFLGRYYIKWLARTTPAKKELFAQLGDVFWFDQYRNLGTAHTEREPENGTRRELGELLGDLAREQESWGAGVEQLREYLVGWWTYYKFPPSNKGQGKHYIKDLERKFAAMFPGTQFRGTMPREGVTAPSQKDFYFLLEREDRLYDLAEMSSGEQAVFSLLYDFVRLNITRSVVLIDELELHLHAPAQQALFAALPRLGSDCQFFITTHSEFLTGIIPDEQEVRIQGGHRCL
ncbi:MAG: AAA family ATPase [Planctomycetia bacterium]|nr:AAA family ATPase [Planctomycetia bacterium]